MDVIPAEFHSERDADHRLRHAGAVVRLVGNLIEGDRKNHLKDEQA